MNDFSPEIHHHDTAVEQVATARWYPPEATEAAVKSKLADLKSLLEQDQIKQIHLVETQVPHMQGFHINCKTVEFANKLGSNLGSLAYQSNERFLRSVNKEHDDKNRHASWAEASATVSTVYAYFPKDRAVATALRAKMAALNPEKGQETSR